MWRTSVLGSQWDVDGVTSTPLEAFVGGSGAREEVLKYLRDAAAASKNRKRTEGARLPALLLVGPSGVGKSTLVHACCVASALKVWDAGAADDPGGALALALRAAPLGARRGEFAVVIDSVDCLSGTGLNQRAALAAALAAAATAELVGAPIVLTALSKFDRAISSIVKHCVVVDVPPLSRADIWNLVARRAKAYGLPLAAPLLDAICAATGSNVAAALDAAQWVSASREHTVHTTLRAWRAGLSLLPIESLAGLYVKAAPPDAGIAVGQRLVKWNGAAAHDWTRADLKAAVSAAIKAQTDAGLDGADAAVSLRLTTRLHAAPGAASDVADAGQYTLDDVWTPRAAVLAILERRATAATVDSVAGEVGVVLPWVVDEAVGRGTLEDACVLLEAASTADVYLHSSRDIVSGLLWNVAFRARRCIGGGGGRLFIGGFPASVTKLADASRTLHAARIRYAASTSDVRLRLEKDDGAPTMRKAPAFPLLSWVRPPLLDALDRLQTLRAHVEGMRDKSALRWNNAIRASALVRAKGDDEKEVLELLKVGPF